MASKVVDNDGIEKVQYFHSTTVAYDRARLKNNQERRGNTRASSRFSVQSLTSDEEIRVASGQIKLL